MEKKLLNLQEPSLCWNNLRWNKYIIQQAFVFKVLWYLERRKALCLFQMIGLQSLIMPPKIKELVLLLTKSYFLSNDFIKVPCICILFLEVATKWRTICFLFQVWGDFSLNKMVHLWISCPYLKRKKLV